MKSQNTGILSAVMASVCCVGPLLLAALGLGGLGVGAFIGAYHWYFIGGATVVLGFAWLNFLRERRRCQTERCEMAGGRLTRIALPLATLGVVAFFAMNVYSYAGGPVADESLAAVSGEATVTIPVKGMTCFACTITVEGSLEDLDGVREATANVQGKSVTVNFNPSAVTVKEMVEALNETGYRAELPDQESI